ncbi:MAG: Carboxynorspermidine decarboxylase, putative (EC [uncultured Thiotrichaceae bacterium]|uniref:Carboxynorspermidine/carboxyspermidine decarboxylase n=1 Tax=uncultured Thiotrichaceae bacterium TaxID=298394 RepID=A0A6S6T8Y6_9GAMM|nr:MAG: Carboxynorspermidine decarboxylase, putative (EC [uncultured Thiotrichaceae bacterium]
MKATSFIDFDANSVPSPCFVVDKAAIERNLQILQDVQERSGAKILAALKAFSFWKLGSLTTQYLSGTCASGLHEARLGNEEYAGELHVFSAAYKEQDLREILKIADHIVFNSYQQWSQFKDLSNAAKQARPNISYGLRINPLHSEGDILLYDPCATGSRLGIPPKAFPFDDVEGIDGLHFHTLCEQDFLPLQRTITAIEESFGKVLHKMKWVNFGGGHHITQDDYQREDLIQLIKDFSQKYAVQVYLEPGEAIAINSGVLVAEVLDIVHNDIDIAILDTSATCHMPDTLEMPYRADIRDAGMPQEKAHSYRLGGMTCLAGDIMGDYGFDEPLQIRQRLIFDDMAHYTMVKTTTFNGINLPSLALWDSRTNDIEIIRTFGYDDFKQRLS